MGIVGQFPLASDLRRRTVRAPVNPIDKSTIVSIYPKRIEERKHTIDPGLFIIQPGTYENPAILVVEPSSWWKEIDDHQPMLEIGHSSIVVAESVIRDYCNGIVGCDMGENMPGLFFIPGIFRTIEVLRAYVNPETQVTFQMLLDEANRKQKIWFHTLVTMADSLWARSGGNPNSVSSDMKLAARELNLVAREWYKDNVAMELVRCKFCGNLKNPAYPICPNCKAIDNPERAKELGIVFAQ